MNSFHYEEKRICRLFDVEEDAIRKYCINRYKTLKGQIFYIDNKRLCPSDSCNYDCESFWITDITRHSHSMEPIICAKCMYNQKIFYAQAEFAARHWPHIKRDYKNDYPEYTQLKKGSTLFGGNVRIRFEHLTTLRDNPHDFIEERKVYTKASDEKEEKEDCD